MALQIYNLLGQILSYQKTELNCQGISIFLAPTFWGGHQIVVSNTFSRLFVSCFAFKSQSGRKTIKSRVFWLPFFVRGMDPNVFMLARFTSYHLAKLIEFRLLTSVCETWQ